MNELVRVDQPNADVRAYRASTEAADICKDIVVSTSSQIQGRNFVSVEGWQAIAVAHGCALSARDVENVEGGVRAIGEVRRMSDGQLIATGEGFVGADEPTWFGGKNKYGKELPKRPDYAIRAMAQTRAMSRAGRTAFAHVVVMMKAGLATTPAEEMLPTVDAETGEIIEAVPERQKVPGISAIKKNLNALMSKGNQATDLETFNSLVHDCADDLTKIMEAKHEYWTGDGGDSEGFKAWIKRRREELSKVESTAFQLLASAVQEARSPDDLTSIADEYASTIAELDGEESRRFETLFNEREESLKHPTPMTAGAYGG